MNSIEFGMHRFIRAFFSYDILIASSLYYDYINDNKNV